MCHKVYKSKAGLSRHMKAKHGHGSVEKGGTADDVRIKDSLKHSDVEALMVETQKAVTVNNCFPVIIRDTISKNELLLTDMLFNKITTLYMQLCNNGNGEKFYAEFYSTIALNASDYLPDLEKPACTLFATKLADKLFHFYKHPTQSVEARPTIISEKEMGGLEYLAGYVVKKFLKKIRNSSKYKTAENQALIAILENFKEENHDSQKLIKIQTRGGLTAVKKEIKEIFTNTEIKFIAETKTNHNLRKIDLDRITDILLKDCEIISAYNAAVECSGITIDNEIKVNLLEHMLKLYLRVRAFSYAKDVADKHKSELKRKKSTSKSLRKDIKKASEKLEITE